MEAGVPKQPLLDRLGLVGGVVVQDQVEFEVLGNGCVDDLQEAEELLVAVAAVVLGYDRAGCPGPRTARAVCCPSCRDRPGSAQSVIPPFCPDRGGIDDRQCPVQLASRTEFVQDRPVEPTPQPGPGPRGEPAMRHRGRHQPASGRGEPHPYPPLPRPGLGPDGRAFRAADLADAGDDDLGEYSDTCTTDNNPEQDIA